MNKCEFLTFQHSLIFISKINVQHPRNNWLQNTFSLFIFYKVKILWLKHQISNNKVITTMFDDKPPNGLWH